MKALLTIGLCLLLLGCAPPQSVNPYTGTGGLDIAFADGAPADEVLENTQIPVRVLVMNTGAVDVSYDDLLITFSADATYIESTLAQLDPKKVDIEGKVLHGRSQAYPRGDARVFAAPFGEFSVKPVLGTLVQPTTELHASVCYGYSTIMSSPVCIDTNAYAENVRAQVCQSQDIILSGGQGAPVAITSVEVEAYPIVDAVVGIESVRPAFTIHMQDAGNGRIIGPRTLSMTTACMLTDIPSEEVGSVRVEAWLVQTPLECQPELVRFLNGEGHTRCTVPMNELTNPMYQVKQNFQSTLIVNVSYLYKTSTSTSIAIRRDPYNDDPDDTPPIRGLVPGYVYDGNIIRKDETGKDITYCDLGVQEGSIPEGFSCACNQARCWKLRSKGGCNIKGDVCPNGRYCCSDDPPKPEEPEELEPTEE